LYSADGRRLLFQTEPSAAQLAASLDREGRTGFRYDQRFFPPYAQRPVLPTDADLNANGGGAVTATQNAARHLYVYDFQTHQTHGATATEAAEFSALAQAPRPAGREHFRDNVARGPNGGLAWTEARNLAMQGGLAPLTVAARLSDADDPVVC